ncbi:ATP-dependent Clp protease adaptor ClpS [Candidatus Ventrimonas sp. KK005]
MAAESVVEDNDKMAVKDSIKDQAKSKTKLPRQYQVLIYNDDFTPMDFVVDLLIQIFDKEEEAAIALMMSIHTGSSAVAGVYPKDIAETKAAEAVWRAREEKYPLKVEAVCLP